MRPYIYIRALREAEHTVFCVTQGQKTYRDPRFGRYELPYSSGQQVKRSILDAITEYLGEERAPITFVNQFDGKKMEQKEPWSPCDPTFADQLLGGWMRAQKRTADTEGGRTVKRRSPFSISAMRPLHPLLAKVEEENITFDRSDQPERHKVIVRDSKGNEVPEADVIAFLESNNQTLTRRRYIQDQKRAYGLFVYDMAIDLRRLFRVSMDQHEPELDPGMIAQLKANGWKEADGHLICPEVRRNSIMPAIAKGLIHWHITSNQSRTFSPMPVLAVVISDRADLLTTCIRADLGEAEDTYGFVRAVPIVTSAKGAELFVAPPCRANIAGIEVEEDALEKAETSLTNLLRSFDYDTINGGMKGV